MTLAPQTALGIIKAVSDKMRSIGVFNQVLDYEPKSPPSGDGLTACVWLSKQFADAQYSGLNSTAFGAVIMVRCMLNAFAEPQSTVDATLFAATQTAFDEISNEFNLGEAVRHVDLFGISGQRLEVDYGYLDLSGTLYRIADITVPISLAQEASQSG